MDCCFLLLPFSRCVASLSLSLPLSTTIACTNVSNVCHKRSTLLTPHFYLLSTTAAQASRCSHAHTRYNCSCRHSNSHFDDTLANMILLLNITHRRSAVISSHCLRRAQVTHVATPTIPYVCVIVCAANSSAPASWSAQSLTTILHLMRKINNSNNNGQIFIIWIEEITISTLLENENTNALTAFCHEMLLKRIFHSVWSDRKS